ncbi:molybdate transport system substrate-binding protein [Hydrogenivirga caldilitoris]|uniref:Molybdate transport system substrate-binding protein n=1 Tax=Hydrogenivirga caldilitoris TaxID=246264 RepID=A0A497XTC6_9AQUI|nr:molybdate ABC transporter substrate-binding protein [Hydrogenivirga caldilitoris]RLJ70392.1 molybdate transport system substrate-binding protein [Hydrogenivirga caldilitoris]
MRLLITLLIWTSLGLSQTLHIAAASSMMHFLERVADFFKIENPGVELKLSYGSSGNLYRKILAGAPYDVFISANELYPKKLSEAGKAFNPVIFAKGKLVLISLKFEVKDIESLELAKNIAVANPKYAPYGRAAIEFLQNTGLYDRFKGKLVYGSNIAQAFQFVVSGGADAGIVPLSLVLAYGRGSYYLVPENTYSPVLHVAVITDKGSKNELSERFLSFLTSDRVKELLKEFGFEVP